MIATQFISSSLILESKEFVMGTKVQEYAKGIIASIGTVAVTVLSLGDQFCGTVWPAVTSILAAILVVAVPNKPKA
jgi:hypothetical protein